MGEVAMSIMRMNSLGTRKFRRWLLCVFFLVSLPHAHAFRLVPITKEFAPYGHGASQAFRVENNSDELLAVQISILRREIDLGGTEHNAPAEDDFIVYPSQMIIKPKQVQTVRVKWVGGAQQKTELAYRILAEQLPIDFGKEEFSGAKINLLVRYLGSIYIVPEGAKPDIRVESAAAATGSDRQRSLQLVLHNQGTAHGLLRNSKLTLESGGKTITLGSEDLPEILGENLLAGNRRRFLVRWPEALPDGPVKASLHF